MYMLEFNTYETGNDVIDSVFIERHYIVQYSTSKSLEMRWFIYAVRGYLNLYNINALDVLKFRVRSI